MQLSPRGRKIYFLIVVLVFGGAILAVSAINGRSPLGKAQQQTHALPFSARTADYFQLRTFKPPEGLFTDELLYYIAPPVVKGVEARKKFPLILLLHDDDGYAAAADYLFTATLRQFYHAFVVVPVLQDGDSWAHAGEVKVRFGAHTQRRADDALHLVQELLKTAPVDPNRIYVLGCAGGGTGVFHAMKNFPDLLTAGIAISGRWHLNKAEEIKAAPLWILHGIYDQRTPARYMQQLAQRVQQLNPETRFTAVPGLSVNCRDSRLYMNALWAWLFAQDKTPPVSANPAPLAPEAVEEDITPHSP